VAGALLGLLGIVVLIDPLRFDWSDRAVVEGHAWLLLAGFSWALAVLHARRHRWRLQPLDVLPWQMLVATILLWILALVFEPRGYLNFSQPNLWIASFYIGVFASPTGTGPPSRSPARRCRRSPARSAPGRRCSHRLVRAPRGAVAGPLVLGTMLVVAGIMRDRGPSTGNDEPRRAPAAYNNSDVVEQPAQQARIAASARSGGIQTSRPALQARERSRTSSSADPNKPILHAWLLAAQQRSWFISTIAGPVAHLAQATTCTAPTPADRDRCRDRAALDWLAANGRHRHRRQDRPVGLVGGHLTWLSGLFVSAAFRSPASSSWGRSATPISMKSSA
jgi:hypothetical protein